MPLIEQAPRLIVQVRVQVALRGEDGDDALAAPGRPMVSVMSHRGSGVDVLLDRVCLATSVGCRQSSG
jgi:hypothetical protein